MMSAKKRTTSHSRPKNRLDEHIGKPAKKSNARKSDPTYIKKKRQRSKQANKKKQRKKQTWQTSIKRIVIEFGLSLILLGTVLYLLSFFTFTFAKVEGYSMVPTLNNDEWVFVSKLAKPKRFKLVLHRDPNSKETSVRRVIGLPGETISYKDDQLYVNDRDVFERFLEDETKRAQSSGGVYTEDWSTKAEQVPKGKYLVLGDNRPYASDSREYGYVDEQDLVGLVEMRVLPLHQVQQF
ncbi:signal peptidase I [Enterococcus sp. DIV0840]